MKKETKTIRIQDMLFSVLYGWKKILWSVVILALALGGFAAIRGAMKLDPDIRTAARQKYEDAMSQYAHAQESLELSIHSLEVKLDEWAEYMEKSVLMNLDHRKVYETRANLYIHTGYQIDPQLSLQNPDYTEAVMIQYATALQSGAFHQEVARKMGMETAYLQELITLTRYGDSTISVLVRHENREDAARIMEYVLSYVEGLTDSISQTVCAHTLRRSEDTVALLTSAEVEELQQQARSDMAQDTNSLMTQWQKREQLEEPTSEEMTVGRMIVSILKFAVIGGVLGGVLAVMWQLASFLLSDKVYSGDALGARTGLRVLGSLDSGKKRGPVEQRLRTVEDRAMKNTPKNRAFIGARAANCCPGPVVLCGTVGIDHMESAVEILRSQGVQVLAAGDVLRDGALVTALRDACGAVALARSGRTTYTDIFRMEEVARDAGKSLLAAIVID